MKVDDFIKKYNSAKDKDKFLADSITKQYIPYHEKISDCEKIIRSTMESDGMFRINTPAQFLIFMILLITSYTEIEREENMLEMFEKLDEVNLINAIVSKIPEREYTSYNTVLNMIQDDYMENNRSLLSYLETKVKALGLSLDALLEAAQKYIPQNTEEEENV